VGKYPPSQFESREMEQGVPWCEIPRLGLRFCLTLRSIGRFSGMRHGLSAFPL
jgi:hypothetical protein